MAGWLVLKERYLKMSQPQWQGRRRRRVKGRSHPAYRVCACVALERRDVMMTMMTQLVLMILQIRSALLWHRSD